MDVRRVGAPYAPHFAWFLHVEQLVFCNMWNSLFFAWFWHDMILHDMILHDMILHGMILHGFCTFFRTVLHVARLFA